MCFIKQQNLTFYLKFSVSLFSQTLLNHKAYFPKWGNSS